MIPVKKGERIHVKVQAAPLGSWLDSVVTLRDEKGTTLAENDDPDGNQNANPRSGVFGLNDGTPDSVLDYEAKAEGDLTLEITDRYGDGGPGYAYRLSVGAPRPDFEVKLLLANPNVNRQLLQPGQRPPGGPGSSGALNLRPGTMTPVNFLVAPSGRPGRVVVKADGLPPGVTSEPVTVAFPAERGQARAAPDALPSSGSIVLRVAANAEPAMGDLRVSATAKLEDGTVLTRHASALLSIDTSTRNNTAQPPLRMVAHIPVKVLGKPRSDDEPKTASASQAPVVLNGIEVPGVLLQGGWVNLRLDVDPPNARADQFEVKAEPVGKGLAVAETSGSASESDEGGVFLRIFAAVDAAPGVGTVKIRFRPTKGEESVRDVAIVIRAPIRVSAQRVPVILQAGGSAELWVSVQREEGYSGPVELKVAGLPQGVKVAGRVVVPAEENGGTLRLVRSKTTKPFEGPFALRVMGVARMPKGPVSVDSAIRPMVAERLAEE